MRSLCTLLELNGISFKANETSIFGQDQASQGALDGLYNYPTINDGDKNIFGDTPTLLKYLCCTNRVNPKDKSPQKVKEEMYPRSKK